MKGGAKKPVYMISATMVIVPACDHFFLGLKVNWCDTLTVKQCEIMINNDVLLFCATNEETAYEQLYHCCYFLIIIF